MSADQKKGEAEERYSFIQERIVPKRRPPLKKFLMSVITTLILAVLFGVTGSLVFCWSGSFLGGFFQQNTGKKITFVSESPSPSPSQEPVKEEDEKEEKKNKKDVKIINSKIDATLKDYNKMYSLMSDLAANVNRSIVTVSSVIAGEDLFNNPMEATESTYGLILADNEENLLILTSRSKIAAANSIRVTFSDGSITSATLHEADKELNLAVIAVPIKNIPGNTKTTYTTAKLGESYSLPPGTPVLALGSPNGYLYSMETGIITTKPYPKYIIDARVDLFNTDMGNHTEGEGIIINLSGEVVGIITHNLQDDSNKNLNTAMGISKIKSSIEKLVNKESRVYLGVVASDITDQYAKHISVKNGIYVTEVAAKSPAFEAGLLCGDIITKIQDDEVTSVSNLTGILDKYQTKSPVKIEVIRTSKDEKPKLALDVELKKKK